MVAGRQECPPSLGMTKLRRADTLVCRQPRYSTPKLLAICLLAAERLASGQQIKYAPAMSDESTMEERIQLVESRLADACSAAGRARVLVGIYYVLTYIFGMSLMMYT